MKKLIIAALLIVACANAGAMPQERKHETATQDDAAATKKVAEPAMSQGMKCCEGMEKFGEMKGGMPMKSGMTAEMKAKMMEKMTEKMAEKTAEKKSSDLPAKSQAEKSQTNMDAHQH